MIDWGRPNIDSQEGAWPQQFVIGNDEAELELSVESRSFVNRRERQKIISNVTENEDKHSMIWGMFMTVTMESAVFTERITWTIVIPSRIQKISH